MTNHLLNPAAIGSMVLRNRLVMAPMGVEIVGADGQVNGAVIGYYEARARGGTGLLLTEAAAFAHPRGANSAHQLAVSDDRYVNGLRALTDRVHAHGAKVAIQLVHHGKVARLDTKQGRSLVVPSVPEWAGSLDMIDDLSMAEIVAMAAVAGRGEPSYHVPDAAELAALISELGDAVCRSQEAGFDGVEIHGAHGYLFSSFLSPQWNRRLDQYGGSVENRSRLLCEAIAESKRRAGSDFPVWCRLDALEYRTPNGIVFEDALVTARLVVAAGADAIHLSAYGDMTSGPAFVEGTLPDREAKHAALSARMRKEVDVPVIGVGRIQPKTGDEMIAHGKADLIAMGRQLLADPETALKISEGRVGDIRPCINCYVCVAQPFFDRRVKCAVNPALGRESELAASERTKAPVAKRIVIVGSGPAGLETARVATPEMVAALDPDEVVIATGAARKASALLGAAARHVIDGDDLRDLLTGSASDPAQLVRLTHQYMPIGKNVVIIGGGLIGIELAEFFVERGRSVAVLEEGEKFALEMAHPRRWRVLGDLRDAGASLVANAANIEIGPNEVRFVVAGESQVAAADHVVMATGLIPDLAVAQTFEAAGLNPVVIGDCVAVGYIEGAIHAGFAAAAAF